MCSSPATCQLVQRPDGARRGLALDRRRPAEARLRLRSGRPARDLPRRHRRPGDGRSRPCPTATPTWCSTASSASSWSARSPHGAPYRQAVVRPVEEPWLNEQDAGVVRRAPGHRRAAALARRRAGREASPWTWTTSPRGDCAFEELVNRVACRARPAARCASSSSCIESLPERGLSVLSILRSRQAGRSTCCAPTGTWRTARSGTDRPRPLPLPAPPTPCCRSAIRSTASSAPTRWRPR